MHAQSDGELACVIGHEVAHVTEGHTAAGAWANPGKQTLTTLVAVAALTAAAYGNNGVPLTQAQVQGAVATGQITSFLLADVPLRLSGWERGQEREADAMGLVYAARAGYDPGDCGGFMLHRGQAARVSGGTEGTRWWTTKPPTAERVVTLRKLATKGQSGTEQLRE